MSLSITSNIMANRAANTFTAQYQQLVKSTHRLSTGLRINGAADDAAGLAVREIMRAEIASNRQGMRNVSDAISMIQVADGALAVINEKLIRLKELAEQAATGTYSQAQREIMHQEFQAMKDEIERIAQSTSFNGIKLLDADRAVTVHFGSENQAGQDMYDVELGDATLTGLGLERVTPAVPALNEVLVNGGPMEQSVGASAIAFARIPAGSVNISLYLRSNEDPPHNFQIFTADGVHLAGSKPGAGVWLNSDHVDGPVDESNIDELILTESNGFNPKATYNGESLNGTGDNLAYDDVILHQITYGGMTIGYSGHAEFPAREEYVTLDTATEDLVILLIGRGEYSVQGEWDRVAGPPPPPSLITQADAQQALETISEAIITKDQIRARLGAAQNRLENTGRVLTITTENLQAAESRISDVDVAQEMTQFVLKQIKTQAAMTMLAQANVLPQMALRLVQG